MLSKGVYINIVCLYIVCIRVVYMLPETSIYLTDYLPLCRTHTMMPL